MEELITNIRESAEIWIESEQAEIAATEDQRLQLVSV